MMERADIQEEIARLEAKIDRLLEIFGAADNSQPRRPTKQLEDEAKKSVLDFQKRIKHKKGHGGETGR